ncbi:APC family permease [Acidithiobacillus thiooxidans]|uniref:APC family permease n=1 Tax=Acidithiobacillus thiooxidans TaxID=930 RepID=UPI00285601D0|nr:APC family permease [Acidithiobacillus thiooxidans]MDR7925792.1 APC family permease [Acidithiobacillus thiooxidans]
MNNDHKVGFINLIFAGVTGIIGSGWLFAPYIAAKMAGPFSIISWLIGFTFAAILAFCYAEIGAMMPARGLMVHIARVSNSFLVGDVWAVFIFMSYSAMPAIETLAFVTYLDQLTGRQLVLSDGSLTVIGYFIAALTIILFLIIAINKVGFVLSINTLLSIGKVIVPFGFAITLICTHFNPNNFMNVTGIYPVTGISTSLTSAGIIFSCLGFRQILEMSGESKSSNQVAFAILFSTIISGMIYLILQTSIIAFFSSADLVNNFPGINLAHGQSAPIFAISISVGLLWLTIIISIEALLSPASTAFLSLTTASRVYYAITSNSKNIFLRKLLILNKAGAPVVSLILVSFISFIFLLPFPSWFTMVKYLTGASAISYSIGPLVLLQLRKVIPDYDRPFKLAYASFIAPIGFCMGTLIICFSGLHIQLFIASVVIFSLFVNYLINLIKNERKFVFHGLSFSWIYFYFPSIIILTFFGPKIFGGVGLYNEFVLILLSIIVSFITLFLALQASNNKIRVLDYIHKII